MINIDFLSKVKWKGTVKTKMYTDKTVDELMEDGFTIKMAHFYADCMKRERESKIWDDRYIDWAHSNGFLAESASAYALSDNNKMNYLPDYDYYKIWPLNSWERIWINDKLTLKYMLSGTDMDHYMPRYYYYYDSDRGLIPLIDNPKKESSIASFCEMLKDEKSFACKPCNGAGSEGFFHLSYKDGYRINGRIVEEIDIEKFVHEHINYIYTEYLFPEESFSKISPLIHTLRIVIVNDLKHEPYIIGGYLRFANKTTGFANHTGNLTQRKEFDYDTEVNWENGYFHSGKAVYSDYVEEMFIHPNSQKIAEGYIENWDNIIRLVKEFAHKYSLCEYLGFDLCISTEGIKIMEINSHPGIKHMQIRKPLLQEGFSKKYFESKIKRINSLDEEKRLARNKLWR